jgi:ABC-type sugar transport system substrate-binding protein
MLRFRTFKVALLIFAVFLLASSVAAQDDSGVDFDCSEFTAAAIVHFQGPYTQQLMDGAAAAAEECGADIITGGPPAFDANATVGIFQDAILAGADAITVVAFPAEFWIRPIDDAVADGVVVSTYDVESPASLQSVHTAPKQKDQGRAMANVLADAMAEKQGVDMADVEGQVVIGICLPGLELIEARIVGFVEQMGELTPDVELIGPLDVAFDQTENFARWQETIDTYPDANAYVGYCENDLPSLVRIKETDPDADYFIGSIGINPDGLQGIADGTALVAIGQKPFMQGYVAMRTMLQSLANDEPVPRGWIDVQPEVVTAENVEEVMAREESLSEGTEQTQAYYQDEIDAIFEDLEENVQSFAALLE